MKLSTCSKQLLLNILKVIWRSPEVFFCFVSPLTNFFCRHFFLCHLLFFCVPYRGNQLPLQSDTRFSSYKGLKVGFDTFLAITLCVYIGAYNNFKTECTLSRGTFLIRTVMSSKVIQGRLWAKRKNMLILGDMGQRKKSLSIF